METIEKPHYLGHRERLRKRLMESAKEALPEYEILELVLCLVKPQGDVKPLAKELIHKFGSIAKVIHAEPQQLRPVKGVGENMITCFRLLQEVSNRVLKAPIIKKSIIETWKSVLDYCRGSMGHLMNEHFRILFLNNKNMLIGDVLQEGGTIDQTPVYTREIIRKALDLGASAILLVHNHPSGDPTPSQEDIIITKRIMAACVPFNITLHDHVIVTTHDHYSMKSHGLI